MIIWEAAEGTELTVLPRKNCLQGIAVKDLYKCRKGDFEPDSNCQGIKVRNWQLE